MVFGGDGGWCLVVMVGGVWWGWWVVFDGDGGWCLVVMVGGVECVSEHAIDDRTR